MSFSKKTAEIMRTLQADYGDFMGNPNKKQAGPDRQNPKVCKHQCSAVEVKIGPYNAKSPNARYTRESLVLQTPIIIEKKGHGKSMSVHKTVPDRKHSNLKKVQPFVPIAIPHRSPKAYKVETVPTESSSRNKEIEIFIDNDGEDKECLKKLFKRIHSLTDQLTESERERVRMQLQLDHLNRRDVTCQEHEKIINRLEGDLYKLKMENDILRKKARLYDEEVPKEREMYIQKPVQVRVEIPKYIPGPERIVQKIVEIPKYIEIEKKIPEIIIKEIKVPQIVEKQVFVEKPIYKDPIIVDKPVFVDKPIYIDRPVQVQKKVEVEVPVEIQVPVYIDRPMVDDEWLRKFHQLEDELGSMMRENQALKGENHKLRSSVHQLQGNLDVLSNHNRQKNRQIEQLLSNRGDYLPLRQQLKLQRTASALDRTTESVSPRSHRHLMYL